MMQAFILLHKKIYHKTRLHGDYKVKNPMESKFESHLIVYVGIGEGANLEELDSFSFTMSP